MNRAAYVAAAVAVVWSVSVSAQGRNFGGQWVIDAEKTSAAAPTMAVAGGGGGGARVITGATAQRPVATTAAVERGGGGGGRGGAAIGPMGVAIDASTFTVTQGETSTAYKLDGSPLVVESGTRRSTSRAAWQGDKLVIQTTTEIEGNSRTSMTTWYLEGEYLVRETGSGDGTGTSRKTYYKRA